MVWSWIVVDSVTALMHPQISFEAKAPPGYTFIPAGNPRFTIACKEVCRKDGLEVFTVSVSHQMLPVLTFLGHASNHRHVVDNASPALTQPIATSP